jgi:YD repeat-containing protein
VRTLLVDANNQVTSSSYDTLGRLTRTNLPGGGWEERYYVGFGAPATQYLETRTSDGTADGLKVRTYFDGLDRTYRMLDEILALAEPRLRIRRVDVDSDPALVRRFGADVPVLCLDDEVLCRHVLDAERLARVLSAAR